ncbi:hypothetical protein LJC72_09110 [Bacteroides sp. OttesenSCG-928-D19]|nr:hypothetical protein [Bacteroides sp. OttesenSCG-928-D19]
MKRQINRLVVLVVVISILFPCVSLAQGIGTIKVTESSRSENFTNDQLRNLLKQIDYPSVVVRNLYTSSSDVSSNANSAQICSILEMGLAKNGLDVRDRSLFDNVLKATSANNTHQVDYQKLYEQTQVDLLMEISSYSINDYYQVDRYWTGNRSRFFPKTQKIVNGKKVKYNPTYILRGMSISVKVIILKDNLIGGTYFYTYVPCSESDGGGVITRLKPLRYIPPRGGRDIEAMVNEDNSSLLQSKSEKLEYIMESFIINTVVPQMMADMKGLSMPSNEIVVSEPVKTEKTIPQASPKVEKKKGNRGLMFVQVGRADNVKPGVNSSEKKQETPRVSPQPKKKNKYQETLDQIAEQERLKAAKKAELQAAEQAKLFAIVPVNSFNKLAPAVSNLITMKSEEENKKKKATLETDIERLDVIKKSIGDIENFIATSTADVGINMPVDAEHSFFYLPTNQGRKIREQGLLLFVDGQCVGVGSSNKGFYSAFPLRQYGSGFHTFTLATPTGEIKFTSTLDFSIKNKFVFEHKGDKIILTN